jgi:PAS domain S-box-containing protein
MNQKVFVELIYNAALLLALGIIFDTVTLRNYKRGLMAEILTGISLGIVALAIMLNPWVLQKGIVFDTRSILLSLTGMFFGAIPAGIAAIIAIIYRLCVGGPGVYTGVSVIITAVLWGAFWKRIHFVWKRPYGFVEFYSLGVVTHVTMLYLMLLMPRASWGAVLGSISLPVLAIYPIATVLLGQIMVHRMQIRRDKLSLEVSEKQFRSLYENAPVAYQSLDINGFFLTVNKAWLKALGYDREDIIGLNFADILPENDREHFAQNFPRFRAAGHIEDVEFHLLRKDGNLILVSFNGKVIHDEYGNFKQTQCIFTDITERRKQEEALRSIEWMLSRHDYDVEFLSEYGDISENNTSRLILDSVGKDVLKQLVGDYLSLLDTSSVVYEKNGDYAISMYTSAWCRLLDNSSRVLCDTDDNHEAMSCGKWLCHESCWTDASKKAIESSEVVDIECNGGIRIYTVPITTSTGVIGAINVGYGSPPKDVAKLHELSQKYSLDTQDLLDRAEAYLHRPPYIIEQAKRKLHTAAKIIAEIVERRTAQQVLAQSEERYRLLTETAQDLIIVHDLNGFVSYANQKAKDFLGVNNINDSSVNMMQFIHKNHHQMLLSHAEDRRKGYLGHRVYQLDALNHKGELRQMEVSSTPIVTDNQIDGILAVIRDVSDRIADQVAIRESQKRFDLFMNNLPGGAFIKDSKSRVLFINRYMKNLVFSDDLIGKTPQEAFNDEMAQTILTEDAMTMEQGMLHAIEEIRHKDGSLHYYDTTKFVLPNPNAEPMIGGVALDVTERKQAEEQRNRYANRLEILREIDSIVLETLSLESVCNAAVEKLQTLIPFTILTVNVYRDGVVSFPALKKPQGEYDYLSINRPYQPSLQYLTELKTRKTILENRVRDEIPRPDMPVKQRLLADGINSMMYNAMIMQNELVGFLWFSSTQVDFFTDEHREIADEFANQLAIVLHQLELIDQIKQHSIELEQKVNERTMQLSTANKELEAFSYSIAHDLRAPLRTIDGFCSILMEDYAPNLPDNANHLLGTIRNTSHRMDTLIRELLDLAKLNRNALKPVMVNMRELVDEQCLHIANGLAPLEFNVSIDDIPDCLADETLINQVWQNLLENAFKFCSTKAHRRIHIGYYLSDNNIVYYVKDSGVGFKMEYMPKIFEAFQRLHKDKEFTGTGIGLAIVKKIIERHNGKVWALSKPDFGTTLFFSIPRQIEQQ